MGDGIVRVEKFDVLDRVEFFELSRDMVAEHGKTFEHIDWRILREIAVGAKRSRYPHTLTSLSDAMDMPRQTVTGRIEALVKLAEDARSCA